ELHERFSQAARGLDGGGRLLRARLPADPSPPSLPPRPAVRLQAAAGRHLPRDLPEVGDDPAADDAVPDDDPGRDEPLPHRRRLSLVRAVPPSGKGRKAGENAVAAVLEEPRTLCRGAAPREAHLHGPRRPGRRGLGLPPPAPAPGPEG